MAKTLATSGCLDSDLVKSYPLLGVGSVLIGVKVVELEVSRPGYDTESIGEWSEARDGTTLWSPTMLECFVGLIIFAPAPHLSYVSLVLAVLDTVP